MKRRKKDVQYINVYDFNMDQASMILSVLEFSEPDENWFDFVCSNRKDAYKGKDYDIAIGAVANDKVYATIGLYESGVLSKEQAIESFKINPLYDQVVLKTEAALSLLVFKEAVDLRGDLK